MTLVFWNLKVAADKQAETKVWQANCAINNEYRRVLGSLKQAGAHVQHRQLEKAYHAHLKVARGFYSGFINRMSLAFKLTKLQRIAHRLQKDEPKTTASEESPSRTGVEQRNAEKMEVDGHLEVFLHSSLLRLGDIHRWTVKLSRKQKQEQNYNTALAYYSMANDVIPTIGDGYQQMALIFAMHRQDLDTVYYFYRSLAVEKPTLTAASNLGVAFKAILSHPVRGGPGKAQTPSEMFSSWFASLHAHYFVGEPFKQQDELEREVLHRMEALLKQREAHDTLLKALLTNIAAFEVADEKATSEYICARSALFTLPLAYYD